MTYISQKVTFVFLVGQGDFGQGDFNDYDQQPQTDYEVEPQDDLVHSFTPHTQHIESDVCIARERIYRDRIFARSEYAAVSYTHLTLPTN